MLCLKGFVTLAPVALAGTVNPVPALDTLLAKGLVPVGIERTVGCADIGIA